jgi:hypothetical protein
MGCFLVLPDKQNHIMTLNTIELRKFYLIIAEFKASNYKEQRNTN